jgi:hypothetical protein
MQVMSVWLTRHRMGVILRGWEDPLLLPFAVRLRVFARQGIGKRHTSEPCFQIGCRSARTRSR